MWPPVWPYKEFPNSLFTLLLTLGTGTTQGALSGEPTPASILLPERGHLPGGKWGTRGTQGYPCSKAVSGPVVVGGGPQVPPCATIVPQVLF